MLEKNAYFLGEICGSRSKRLLVKRFLVLKWSLQINQESFLTHPTSPWMAQLLTQVHQNVGILPATSNNANIIAQIWFASDSRWLCNTPRSVIPALTLIKTELLEENAPTSGVLLTHLLQLLPVASLQLLHLAKGFYYRETQTLHQVVTSHFEIFLLNRTYKTRKLPVYFIVFYFLN